MEIWTNVIMIWNNATSVPYNIINVISIYCTDWSSGDEQVWSNALAKFNWTSQPNLRCNYLHNLIKYCTLFPFKIIVYYMFWVVCRWNSILLIWIFRSIALCFFLMPMYNTRMTYLYRKWKISAYFIKQLK